MERTKAHLKKKKKIPTPTNPNQLLFVPWMSFGRKNWERKPYWSIAPDESDGGSKSNTSGMEFGLEALTEGLDSK